MRPLQNSLSCCNCAISAPPSSVLVGVSRCIGIRHPRPSLARTKWRSFATKKSFVMVSMYMKASELRQKSKGELEALLAGTRQRVMELRVQGTQRKVKNVREISAMRKEVARVLTVLRER